MDQARGHSGTISCHLAPGRSHPSTACHAASITVYHPGVPALQTVPFVRRNYTGWYHRESTFSALSHTTQGCSWQTPCPPNGRLPNGVHWSTCPFPHYPATSTGKPLLRALHPPGSPDLLAALVAGPEKDELPSTLNRFPNSIHPEKVFKYSPTCAQGHSKLSMHLWWALSKQCMVGQASCGRPSSHMMPDHSWWLGQPCSQSSGLLFQISLKLYHKNLSLHKSKVISSRVDDQDVRQRTIPLLKKER